MRKIILDASVIIPSARPDKYLKDIISNLLNQESIPSELIIIDNSIKQYHQASALVRLWRNKCQARIRYIKEKKIGTTYTRNKGIRTSKNDILIFLDDDCLPQPKWLEKMFLAQKRHSRSVIQGRSLNGFQENIFSCVEYFEAQRFFLGNTFARGPIAYSKELDTKSFSFRKSEFPANFFFDNNFSYFHCEDRDFGKRALRSGADIIYNPEAMIVHYGRTDFWNYLKREFSKGRGNYLFWKKWNTKFNRERIILKNFGSYSINIHNKKEYFRKVETSLKQEVLLNKSFQFRLLFHLYFILSRLIIKIAFIYELIKGRMENLFEDK